MLNTKNSDENPQEEKILPLILKFSKNNTRFAKAIQRYFQLYKSSTIQCKMLVAYTRHKNLLDLLVHSQLKKTQGKTTGKTFCQEHQNRQGLSDSRNMQIYKKLYLPNHLQKMRKKICRTQNTISTRLNSHKYNIRKELGIHKPIINHFIQHSIESMYVKGLEHNPLWTKRNGEKWWINQLGTKIPHGLNDILLLFLSSYPIPSIPFLFSFPYHLLFIPYLFYFTLRGRTHYGFSPLSRILRNMMYQFGKSQNVFTTTS